MDARPNSWLAWPPVFAWYGVILLTIPYARTIQDALSGMVGNRLLYVFLLPLFALAGIALVRAVRRNPGQITSRLLWLAAVSVFSVWVLATQLNRPIEYIHFVEYAILSLLLFRAWRNRVPDSLVFVIAAAGIVAFAFIDELIQWAVPGRYWDYEDIRLNFLSGAAMQVFCWKVLRTASADRAVRPESVRILCRHLWVIIALYAFAFWNTPARVERYAAALPFLSFLQHNESVMTEYGFHHDLNEVGSFYSRMTLDELRATDRSRGAEAGVLIADTIESVPYMEFLRQYPASRDAYVHELRVRLFRRNHYESAGWQYRVNDPERFTWHMTVADRENAILAACFPAGLAASGQAWPSETEKEVRGFADVERAYTSPVSDHLITGWPPRTIQTVFLVLALAVGMIYRKYG